MSSLFGLNKPNTNLRKNVFDLSEKTLFSLSAGMLVPCLTREVNPGEKIQLHVSALTRTQPLNTAAFVRCRQYYHWFFVPMKQLWTYWDNFINGVDFRTSTLMKSSAKKSLVVPSIGLWRAFGICAGSGTWKNYKYDSVTSDDVKAKSKDELGYPLYYGSSRLLDMLGYGFSIKHDKSQDSDLSDRKPWVRKIFPGFVDISEEKYNKDLVPDIRLVDPTAAKPIRDGRVRMTESDFNRYKVAYDSVYIKHFNTLSEFVDSFSNSDDFYNLLKPFHKTGQYENQDRNVNLFRFLAYQKIYQDFYRREDYEASAPEFFNIDDFKDAEAMSAGLDANRLSGIFKLQYRSLPKDYFTGVVPSELFGSDNIFTKTGFESLGDLSIALDGQNYPEAVKLGSANVTTKSIRAAFAIEKMMRLGRRAGGFDYISQTLAHYGFEPPKGRGDKVDFLGGTSMSINISEVVTTADSGEAVPGQVFGKGLGTLGEKDGWIDFTAREHGIVMCITSVVPETEYSSEGLNVFNTKLKRGDYFHPELQDLGLQPVFGFEYKNKGSFNAGGYVDDSRSGILGFVPRYGEYKTAFDTLHGEFRNGRTLSNWASRSTLAIDDTGVMINTLKIDPKCLDSIFAVNFDGREKNDQFMVSAQFLCKIVRPMSVTGQNL